MKKTILASTIGLFLGVGAAQAEVTLYDYKEGTSAYEDAYVTGALDFHKNRDDDQNAYSLNLKAEYDRTISTPDRDVNFGGAVTGGVSRDGKKGSESVDSYTASAGVSVDNYFVPGSNGAFWYGSAAAKKVSGIDDMYTEATVGVGYGRVTNVTPMAKAIRVVDELVRRNVLRSKPSVQTYQDIARIISKQDEYKARYGSKDYEIKWISDIEAAVQQSGLANSLGAAGTLKARDVLFDERISTRRIGWKVRAGLGYMGSNFDGLTDKPLLEVGGEYHRPLSNQTQFSDKANFNAILNDGDNGYDFDNTLSVTHEIDDRIDWENAWQLLYSKNTLNGDDVTTNVLSSTFFYEIANSLDFTTTASITNVNGSSSIDQASADGTDRALTMGVTYRLR
ncbi:DUF481 domain-containing protein [uncultured Thiothrix sp.]|mgnify:CR=1 FL=1|uniref:DUF481 domain-containing protein n=1 Tax=uncultured Thiothrix sp. TaxID=223185 RepID=UPI002622C7AB|nr:DUF481 domain-containing protein [uncultured Thiothrix sp.]